MDPTEVDRWFSPQQQQQQVARLVGRSGLTRRRAECFVRLWAYLTLKSLPKPRPLSELQLISARISCTHREAAALFYHELDQGSERAAGMMLDTLMTLGLISKTFDGTTCTVQILRIPQPDAVVSVADVVPDAFSPRNDAVVVANLLANNYHALSKFANSAPPRKIRLLRAWAQHYPTGMRVLRRVDNHNPVGFYLLYPIAPEYESCFFIPPNRSLHLSSPSEEDPIRMATPGDPHCQAIFVRSFVVDEDYLSHRSTFLKDVQQVLQTMLVDFPHLCDMHTIIVHPNYEKLALALGFQKSCGSPRDPLFWMHVPLDRFLGLDIDQVLAQSDLS